MRISQIDEKPTIVIMIFYHNTISIYELSLFCLTTISIKSSNKRWREKIYYDTCSYIEFNLDLLVIHIIVIIIILFVILFFRWTVPTLSFSIIPLILLDTHSTLYDAYHFSKKQVNDSGTPMLVPMIEQGLNENLYMFVILQILFDLLR